jgi:uncharacterized protein YoxC
MEQIISFNKDLSATRENLNAVNTRIHDINRVLEGIHLLATNVETLALQVKTLTQKLERSVEKLEASQASQGERIGNLEKKPAARWESLVTQVIGLVVSAVVGFFIAKLIGA